MADTSALVGNVKDLLTKAGASATKTKTGAKELGKDAFLQLLVTQLKNQDPMKPMDDTAFISQMAQFSSLEQMQNLNKTMASQQQFASLSQAAGMIGKFVTIQKPGEEGTLVTGQVSEVRSAAGVVKVVVNNQEYDSSNINQVSATPITLTASQQGAQTLAVPAGAAAASAAAATPTPAAATTSPTDPGAVVPGV